MEKLRPQKGAQEAFLATSADICIYGGAAGGGKSYGLLLEPLRHLENGNFGAVIFRKNSNQIFAEGGLWDTAWKMYPLADGEPKKTPSPMWVFPSGMKVTFAHMDMEKDVHKWQGSQIPLIGFDELTHFTKKQFVYMLSRNRSTCGVKPYIRATCNPDRDSWVREFIDWWIGDNGYADPEKGGKIRWMGMVNDAWIWGDTPEEVEEKSEGEVPARLAKSVTFIPSKLADNKILMEADPSYLANLKALSTVDRERLLEGNWDIRPAAGLYFKRSKVNILDELPSDIVKMVRAWDLAATEDRKNQRPEDGAAYTAGVLLAKRRNGRYLVVDVINQRLNAAEVQNLVKNTAIVDKVKYKHVRIRMNQDPAQAGKAQAQAYIKLLQGFSINIERETGDKVTRFEPFAAQCLGLSTDETGNVDVMAAEWNEAYFSQLESFPEGKFKDMADASATAFNELEKMPSVGAPPKRSLTGDRISPWTSAM